MGLKLSGSSPWEQKSGLHQPHNLIEHNVAMQPDSIGQECIMDAQSWAGRPSNAFLPCSRLSVALEAAVVPFQMLHALVDSGFEAEAAAAGELLPLCGRGDSQWPRSAGPAQPGRIGGSH